jgi:hypothetical protein
MSKPATGIADKLIACIYFIGFEILLYYSLSYLLFDQVEKNPDQREAIILKNWNAFTYFILLYAAVVIAVMLLLTSSLSRKYKPQVMFWFWLSWPGLLLMLLFAFN